MSTLDRNRKLSIGCPKCKEPFQETIAQLETNATFDCPICGPVQVDAEQLRDALQKVKRVLSDLERVSPN